MKPEIKPFGVGDLIVVKQRIAKYEAGEIAHIENVMATESRSREHRRLNQREETFITEFERQAENTKDLQSTERYELQQESQKTIKSESKFEAGTNISGSYGPVTFSAYGKYESSNSKEESERNASNYAKEITEKSVNKVIERVREERKTRILEEIEETNKHGFDNSGGNQNFAGVYRWVDKYYRSKLVNYGKRLMYEFIIPEPAAFYIFAQQAAIENGILPVEPQKPTDPVSGQDLRPDHVTRTNYFALLKNFKVEGVSPPPPRHVHLAKTISKTLSVDDHWSLLDEELTIPEGYEFQTGYYQKYWRYKTGDKDYYYAIYFGSYDVYTGMGGSGPISNYFPVGGVGRKMYTILLHVEISCQLRDETFQKWQLATYSAIMNAYHKQRMDYEEQLAAIKVQGGVEITGRNPLINREIEREALKKSSITVWANEYFGLPAGIYQNDQAVQPPDNYPEIAIDNALEIGEAIQFFEQAFDWANMTYEFYPYYWGRKEHWLSKYVMEDDDPLFEEFLKAGSARVIVPVNLSHTRAVLWYQLNGSVWPGGEIPAFEGDDDQEIALYNSYLEDLGDTEGKDEIHKDIEISPDDPDTWLVKVPTSLVWLQGDAALPDFEADAADTNNGNQGDGGNGNDDNGNNQSIGDKIRNFFQCLFSCVVNLFTSKK